MRKRNENFRCKLLGAGFDITVFTLRYADFIGNKLLGIIVVLPQGTTVFKRNAVLLFWPD